MSALGDLVMRPRAQPAGAATALPTIALAALAILLAWHCLALINAGLVIAAYPYGLDYGEGIVWQQMRNMLRGTAYGPLGTYPAIVYHYPPVYHLTVGLVAALCGTDALATGRIVSLLATLASGGIIAHLATRLSRRHDPATIAAAVAGGLIFLACEPVVDWAALMRVDMLATALGLGGLAWAIGAVTRPMRIVPAALCFVLAVYTKQVSVAAPAAAFFGLLTVRPRLAWGLAGLCAALGLIALAALSITTNGGFLRHILIYNINRVWPEMISALVYPLRRHLLLVVLAAVVAVGVARTVDRGDPARTAAARILLVFLAIKTAMLAMIVKSGANLNYTIEWFAALAVFAGAGLAWTLDRRRPPLLAAAILAGLCFQVWSLPRWQLTAAGARSETARLAPLVARVAAARGPVIADDMVLLIRAGRDVEWEPAITAELGATGRYDQAGFIRLVRAGRFAFFVTEGDERQPLYRDRYNPPVRAAIAAAYPRIEQVAGYTLHLPAERAPISR